MLFTFFQFCVIGTPGQRGPQVSLIVNGRLIELKTGECRESCRIAVTGNLFMDVQDASRVSFLDTLEGNYGESNCDKENLINGWRQSRMSILERADWVVPAYGPPFKVNKGYFLKIFVTLCLKLLMQLIYFQFLPSHVTCLPYTGPCTWFVATH